MDESRIHTAGKRGEDLAVSYLERHQCEILARNWHSRFGEIDIIAQNAVHLIFLEVKTRTFGAQDRKNGHALSAEPPDGTPAPL